MSKYGYFVILERPDWSIAVSLRRPGRELRQSEATLRPPHVLRPMKDRQEHWQVSEPPTKTSHDHFHRPCQTSSRPRLSRQVSRQRLNISAESPDSAIIPPPLASVDRVTWRFSKHWHSSDRPNPRNLIPDHSEPSYQYRKHPSPRLWGWVRPCRRDGILHSGLVPSWGPSYFLIKVFSCRLDLLDLQLRSILFISHPVIIRSLTLSISTSLHNPLILSFIPSVASVCAVHYYQQLCIQITFSPSLSSPQASTPCLSTSTLEPTRQPW